MGVGAFPGFANRRKRTIRGPINPMDKSTIVSIYPKNIDERKPTIEPGKFVLQPGSPEKPTILVVGPSSWWKEIDEEQPLLEIPNSSVQIAKSVVNDYCNGLLGCDMGKSMPGLYWVPGEFTVKTVMEKHPTEYKNAVQRQIQYFTVLVKMADALWARTNGNPLVISDDMRLGARMLKLEAGKEWMKDFTLMTKSACPACGQFVNLDYPVCANCKNVINPAKAKELGLQFAV